MDENTITPEPSELPPQPATAQAATPLQKALESFYCALIIAQYPGAFKNSTRTAEALEDQLFRRIQPHYEVLSNDGEAAAFLVKLLDAAVDLGAARLLAHLSRGFGDSAKKQFGHLPPPEGWMQ